MKNFLFTLSFLLTTSILSAQFQIGLKVSSPSLSNNQASDEYYIPSAKSLFEVNYLSTRTSYAYGLSLYKDVGTAYLGADILYRGKTVQYKVDEIKVLSRNANLYTDTFKELSVPVVAGYRKNNFKVGVGPVFTFQVDGQYSLNAMEGFEIYKRKIDTGFQFQLGYIIKNRIHVDLNHQFSFNQSGDEYKVLGKQMNLKSLPQFSTLNFGIYL